MTPEEAVKLAAVVGSKVHGFADNTNTLRILRDAVHDVDIVELVSAAFVTGLRYGAGADTDEILATLPAELAHALKAGRRPRQP